MNIALITGGAGFIGSHIAEELAGYDKVIIVDNLLTGMRSNIPQRNNVHFIQGDITDEAFVDSLFEEYGFEHIFHMAAVASVQASVTDPWFTKSINLDGTHYLLEKARGNKALKRFVFASSAAVYGNTEKSANSEYDPVNPITPYGLEKYTAERYCMLYAKYYGVPAVAFRFFNVYGERQNPKSPYSGVISVFMDRAVNGEAITIYGDGEQTRDFVYVKDLVNVIGYSLTNDAMIGRVYNIGTGESVSVNKLCGFVRDATGSGASVEHTDGRDGDLRHSCADIGKLRAVGYRGDFVALEHGIQNLCTRC